MSLDARLSPQVDVEHPWLGLESFSRSTRSYFFGRDAEAAELLQRLQHHPLLVFYGRSGLGKTSLLRARLVPDLEKLGARPAFYRINYGKEEDSPLNQLAVALEAAERISVPGFALPEDVASRLWLHVHRREHNNRVTHLILDQFEEIFTLGAEWPEADAEVRQALAILVQGAIPSPVETLLDENETLLKHFHLDVPPLPVLLSLRQDYVFALNRWRSHLRQLGQNHFELRELRGSAAFDAVFKPGELRCNYQGEVSEETKADTGLPPIVSKEIAGRIVHFAAKAKEDVPLEEIEAVPPILSLLCHELNERRFSEYADVLGKPAAQITFHEAETDVETIIATFYERCLEGLPDAVRIFIEEDLVSRSGIRLQNDERSILEVFTDGCEIPGAADYRRAAGYGDQGAARACLENLVNQRVLTALGGGENPSYELVHDLLAAVVEKSRTARQERLEKERVEYRAKEELKAKEDAARWRELEVAQQLARSEAERAAEAERRAHDQRVAGLRLRRLFRILTLVALAAVALAIFGFWQRVEANRQAILANEARQSAEEQAQLANNARRSAEEQARLATAERTAAEEQARVAIALRLSLQSSDLLDKDLKLSLLLAVEAVRMASGDQIPVAAEQALRTAVSKLGGSLVARTEAKITALAISPDGRRLLTASIDKTARLWDLESGKAISEPMRHEDSVLSAQFSPNGRLLVTASDDDTARVWDALSGRAISEPMKHEGPVYSARFSPNAQRVITASEDKTARLWHAATGKEIGEPMWHDGPVFTAQFSPNGLAVTTTSRDGLARLWTLTDQGPGGAPIVFRGARPLTVATIRSDNRWLITASSDGTAQLWDLTGKDPTADAVVLRGHTGPIDIVVISQDKHWLVTGSFDNAATLWDLTAKDPAANPLELPGNQKGVRAVAVSPNNRWLVTGGSDGSIRLWFIQMSDLIEQARIAVGRNLTANEWALYFPGVPYHKTFPEL